MDVKRMIFISLMLTILTTAAVSASDGNVTSQELAISEDSIIDSSFIESDEFLGTGEGTFSDLSALIGNTSENGILELDKDYQNKGNESQITISKAMTIDGKGHTIDADSKSSIFKITAGSVTLRNITFKNAHASANGGAVYFGGSDGKIIGCSFDNCFSTENGGAVYFNEVNNLVENSSFVNCSAKSAGVIFIDQHFYEEDYNLVKNCSFIDCYGESGGAIIVAGDEMGRPTLDVIDCIFKNCSAKNSCGAFNAPKKAINCMFIDCSADNGGAIGFYSDYNCMIENCTFTNCSAKNYGGAIYLEGSNRGNITGCTFMNCFAKQGGAIHFNYYYDYVYYGNPFGCYKYSVVDSTFKKCSSSQFGGAIFMIGDDNLIDNCDFNECSSNHGGAIYLNDTSYYDENTHEYNTLKSYRNNITNCYFVNCSSTSLGGAVYWKAYDGRIENSNFTESHAKNGGAVYAGENIILNISGSKFDDNVADELGGAIYFNNWVAPIGCTFNGNSDPDVYAVPIEISIQKKFTDLASLINSASPGDVLELNDDYVNDGSVSGDGIEISKSLTIEGKGHTLDANGKSRIFRLDADNIILKNMTFINGYSTGCGGAIYNTGNFKISSCNFINCFAGDCGGAIDNDGGISNITLCNFTDCTATDGGGGIYNQENSHYITFCSFVNCSCNNYGGAIGNGGTGERYIGSCSFVNCSSHNYGGAIDNGANCNIISCSFVNCSADSGGAIFVNYLGVCEDIKLCSFNDCSASNDGGAIYTRGECQIISSCSFTCCSAGLTGGAICISWLNDPEVIINDCNFTGCLANEGSAVYVDEEGIARISNSTFENNNAKSGSVIFGGIIFDCVVNEKTSNPINSPNNYAEIIPKNITSNDDGIITITLPSDAKGTLELFIDGNSVAVVEIVNGIAKIDLSKYKDGTFPITFRYSGDENYPGFEKNSTATILFILTRISAPNISVLYAAGQKYLITVYESEGIAARNALVSIKINGKAFNPLYTTALGVASFKVTQVPGTYKLTITSLERTVQSKLTVKHLVSLKSVAVKKSAKKLVLQATLGKVNGKYLKNKKITFKFNGKKYTAKTNKKGVAKVTIKSKVLKKLKVGKKVTYQATYLKDTVKKTVKIKK